MINNGKIKVEINPEKQNRHLIGHKLYEEYKLKNLRNGNLIPSYIILKNDELNELILQKAGSGKLVINRKGQWKNKEIIDFGKNIGKDYIDGKFINTQWGTVHYSKTGSNIIPNGKDDKN